MTISETARIAPGAQIGQDVMVGDFTLIGDRVTIGDDSVIDSHCIIGYDTPLARGRGLHIGPGAHIRSHSVFYLGSDFGPGLMTGHHATVREGVSAGHSLQVGTFTDLQGDTRIGDYVRTHSGVFVAKYSTIGNYVWLFPHVLLANDRQPPSPGPHIGPTIADYAVVAAQSVVMPGVYVGERAVVGAGSLVREDVAEDTLVVGSPARVLARASEVMQHDDESMPAYPWMTRFHRGYPPDVVARWMGEWSVGVASASSGDQLPPAPLGEDS